MKMEDKVYLGNSGLLSQGQNDAIIKHNIRLPSVDV